MYIGMQIDVYIEICEERCSNIIFMKYVNTWTRKQSDVLK